MVELGSVVLVIRLELPLYIAAMAVISYQLGGMFNDVFHLKTKYGLAALVMAVATVFVAVGQLYAVPVVVLFLSTGLQVIRRLAASVGKSSTFAKRSFRIIGFCLSGVFTLKLAVVIAVITVIFCLILLRMDSNKKRESTSRPVKLGHLGWIMLIHQSHYFVYAYGIPILLLTYFGMEPILVGPVFCIGWLSYVTAKKLFGTRSLFVTFAVGHLWSTIILLLLFFYSEQSITALLVLWFLTGFGGGTVYCLRELEAQSKAENMNLDAWESYGHITGSVLFLLILVVRSTVFETFLVGSLIAAITCLAFVFSYWHNYHKRVTLHGEV